MGQVLPTQFRAIPLKIKGVSLHKKLIKYNGIWEKSVGMTQKKAGRVPKKLDYWEEASEKINYNGQLNTPHLLDGIVLIDFTKSTPRQIASLE